MSDALDDAADDVRRRLNIPPVGAPENRSDWADGWLVTANGTRFIGMIRRYDIDLSNERENIVPRLLARELLEHVRDDGISTHISASFAQMDGAHHHVNDPALVLAIASRESSPRGAITLSRTYRCSYHRGGLDDLYGRRRALPLPPAVRRRLRPATDPTGIHIPDPQGGPEFTHVNESGKPIRPADMPGFDQVIVYAAAVLFAFRQLRAQVRRVFETDPDALLDHCSTDARRAWTQVSFGRGGGGGLVHALQRAHTLGSLETIFTDTQMLESDSVKRGRVTAGDASLIDQFVIPYLTGSLSAQPITGGNAP